MKAVLGALALVPFLADAISLDARLHEAGTETADNDAPVVNKRPSIVVGSKMEITVPFMGDRTRSWIPCTVTAKEDYSDRYTVSVDGFPKRVKTLQRVPADSLRPAAPQAGFSFEELSGAAQATGGSNASAALAYGLGAILAAPPGFDCMKHPGLCKAPFNCQTFAAMEGMDWYYHGMAKDGKANPRAWCSQPKDVSFLSTCLNKVDLVKAAEVRANSSLLESQVDRELDASRCFIEGFCSDTAITRYTTLEQANQLCNLRYGRERWSLYGTYRAAPEDSHGAGGHHKGQNGYAGKHQTTPVTLGACATGRFHCDVMYCKQTYCKLDYYRKKYGHFVQPL